MENCRSLTNSLLNIGWSSFHFCELESANSEMARDDVKSEVLTGSCHN